MKILAKICSSSTKQCGIFILHKKNNKYVWAWLAEWAWLADEFYYKKYTDLFREYHISYEFVIQKPLKMRINFDHQDILEENLCNS